MRNNKCELEKSKEFENLLKSYNTNINVFIKLYNLWSRMSVDERGECIDKLVWK